MLTHNGGGGVDRVIDGAQHGACRGWAAGHRGAPGRVAGARRLPRRGRGRQVSQLDLCRARASCRTSPDCCSADKPRQSWNCITCWATITRCSGCKCLLCACRLTCSCTTTPGFVPASPWSALAVATVGSPTSPDARPASPISAASLLEDIGVPALLERSAADHGVGPPGHRAVCGRGGTHSAAFPRHVSPVGPTLGGRRHRDARWR